MANPLRDVRDAIVAHEDPASILIYADKLMENHRTMGGMFMLTRRDAWLLPVLENYAENLLLWVKFVRNVRDQLERGSPERAAVQEFNKTLGTRTANQKLRAILTVALDLAVRTGLIEDNVAAKERYAKRCRTIWQGQRKAMLDNARLTAPRRRISLDVQDDLLAEFWDALSERVNNGEIPNT